MTTRGRLRAACTLGLISLLAVSACGDDEEGGGDAASAADLAGRSFVAVETEGITLVQGSEVTIAFTEDTISVATGCNTITGGYSISGGKLETSNLAQTQMACDEALTAQEQWINSLLSAEPTIEFTSTDALILTSGSDSMTATEEVG